MSESKTGIEIVADALMQCRTSLDIGDVLVPEQCMEFFTKEGRYSLSVEKCDDDGPDEDDTLRSNRTPAVSPEQAAVPKANFAELRKAVMAMEKEFRDEVASWGLHENHVYNTFEVLSSDLSTRVIVLCHAQGLEDLFDQLSPWQGGDAFDWEQKAIVVRALKAATSVMESLDVMLTAEFECGEWMPKIYIQMSC